MSKNVLDKKSSPPQEATTEFLTSANRSVKPQSDLDLDLPSTASTEELRTPDLHDSDATMRQRPNVTPPRGITALQRLAGYEIVAELGRGGMGVVYQAWQHSLQRTVAVKMILAGSFAAAEDLQRFRAEAMAIARLHHPHLLNIFEIGESDQLPFYAMEYMEGGSLARRLNGQPIAPRVAASLLRNLAQAMDYAHKNGIVHRDLKPANILLSGAKDTPLEECLAKITDFGIAKHLYQDSSCTRTGDILGTPHYMSPEQAMGNSTQVGPVADVYSLGAILYELLAGRTPFHGHDGADVLIRLAKEEPERPTHWQRSIPRDLETICLKCLEKDPNRRYASAGALADDLERFLQNETIHAKPATLLDRSVKWTRRRPALATVMLLAGCLLFGGFGMMALMMRQAVEHATLQDQLLHQAVESARLKEANLTQSNSLLADAYLERGNHLAEKGDVRRGMHWMLRSLAMTEESERIQRKPSDLAPIIRMNLACWGQCVSSREVSLPHTDWVWDLGLSPDQQFVATGSKDMRVQIWHAQTGQAIGDPLEHPYAVWGLAFHPDGRTLFTICGDYSKGSAGQLRVWAAHPDKLGQFVPRGEPVSFPYSVNRMLLHPQGDRLWITSRNGLASLFSFDPKGADNGIHLLHAETDDHCQLASISNDGTLLATINGQPHDTGHFFLPNEKVQLWNARTGERLGVPFEHKGLVRTAIFSKDNRHLIVGGATHDNPEVSESSRLHVWDIAERKQVAHSSPMSGRVKTATMAPNGQLFAVSMFEYTRGKDGKGPLQVTDGHINLWQLHSNGAIDVHGSPLRTNHVVWSMEFSPDSRMLLAGCENSGAFLWSVSNCLRLVQPIWHEGNCVKVLFSKDGRFAVTASAGGGLTVSARLWEVPAFSHIGPPLSQPGGIRSAFWEKDGAHAWIGCQHSIARWDPIRGIKTEEISMPDLVYHYHGTGDDKSFLADIGFERMRSYDRDTQRGSDLALMVNHNERGYGFDYHREAKIFTQYWTKPSKFRILDREGKALTQAVHDPEYELFARCLSPQGDTLAVSQSIRLHTNRVVIYNAKDLSVRREIPLKHAIHTLAFTPDGKTLVFGGRDRQVQRYNIETGEFIGSPLLHEGIVQWAGYLGNDRLLATSSEKGMILLWDVRTGKRIGPAFEHHANMMTIQVHPQGKYLLTGTQGKMAMTWRIPEPVQGSLDQIRTWVETMTGMEMNEHDTIVPIDRDRLLERRQHHAAAPAGL